MRRNFDSSMCTEVLLDGKSIVGKKIVRRRERGMG